MTADRCDVLVIGLGPAGAAAAIRLARAGLSVTAVDRAAFPREKICSEYLNPETVRQLGLLGVLDELKLSAVPLHGARVFGPRAAELTGLFRRAGVAGMDQGMSLPRRVLDLALVERARSAGVRVLERCQLLDLVRADGAVAGAVVRQGGREREIGARVVLGADGLHSVTARLMGGRWHEPLRRYGFVAHVAGVPDVGYTAEMHVGRGLYVGLNTVSPGVTNVAVVASARLVTAARGDPAGFWRDAVARFPLVRDRVRPDAVVRPVLATGPFGVHARRITAAGALLLGDAAGFFDPFTGEGVCTALRDAEMAVPVVLAALAAHRSPPAAALAPYRARRRRAYAGKWTVERLIGYGMLAPALFDRAIGRLERRGMSHTLIGVTGEIIPARAVLNPGFLLGMVV